MKLKKDNKQYNKEKSLTPKQQKEAYFMFFGPYKQEWKDEKGFVDNTDATIARRLKVSERVVCSFINKIVKEHFRQVIEMRMKSHKKI